jgi:hypothetical protein
MRPRPRAAHPKPQQQEHQNEELYQKAVSILENYFEVGGNFTPAPPGTFCATGSSAPRACCCCLAAPPPLARPACSRPARP